MKPVSMIVNVLRCCSFAFISALVVGCSSSDVLKDVPLPEPDSDGAKLMLSYCADCHGAPQPSTHAADEWENIVQRMQDHRVMKAMPDLDAVEKSTLLSYLTKYAR